MATKTLLGSTHPAHAWRDYADAEQWFGCYGERGDLFCAESYKHPAKMAVQLCYRIIFEHGQRRGYWKPGDHILDPMAGIGTTGVVGASLGYDVTLVELELHFCQWALDNLSLLYLKLPQHGHVCLLQDDARQLRLVLAAALLTATPPDSVLTSPPYADQDLTGAAQFRNAREPARPEARSNPREGYSGAVSSPPYSDATFPGGAGRKARALALSGRWVEAVQLVQELEAEQVKRGSRRAVRSPEAIRALIERALVAEHAGYNAPAAVVTSPPFCEAKDGGGINVKGYGDGSDKVGERTYSAGRAGRNPAQIGNLPDPKGDIDIANQSNSGRTYLSEMRKVYAEISAVLKPGGVVCLVTKNPVKRGQIRRLDLDTIRLMEHVGFRFLERQRAMLAEEGPPQLTLDGSEHVQRRERKSFFKRLFERDHPHLRVDHEDVLWFQKE
ncbi:MAG: site-specific DNA-methyltransferase [Acidobacteria bacterium]|nr:site-specific DNA-methyltransferase [Acidobacteriota bacterium]